MGDRTALADEGHDHQSRLQEQAVLYRTLFETMSEGFVLCEAVRDAQGRLVDYWIRDANPAFTRRLPAERPFVGRRIRELVPDVSDQWLSICHRVLRSGEPVRLEYWDRITSRWYDVHFTKLSESQFAQFYVDVTARKRAEARQAELFEELNHRVKNNLTIISALLAMQARTVEPPAREQLQMAVDRIQSIADLHASLYRQRSLEKVDFKAYLEALCNRLAASLIGDARIRLEVACQAASLSSDHAVPLGLIVNELVTNAVKHAYPPPAVGVVTVSFEADEAGCRLVVADRGRGLALEGEDQGGGLGVRLVRSLIRQLRGELVVEPGQGQGVAFQVRLPPGVLGREDGEQRSLL